MNNLVIDKTKVKDVMIKKNEYDLKNCRNEKMKLNI